MWLWKSVEFDAEFEMLNRSQIIELSKPIENFIFPFPFLSGTFLKIFATFSTILQH